jgi:hypothetical protein
VALTLGAKLDIPAESVVKLNFDDSTDNNIGGWVPSFTPVGPELSGSVSVSASVGPRIQLEVGVTILGFGAGVGLALSAPTLGLSLGAEADTAGGICENPDAQLGVNVDVGLSAQLDAFAGIGDLRDLPNRFEIAAVSTPLFATCITIGGSAPSDVATVPVDAPAATPTDDAPALGNVIGNVNNFISTDSEDCSSIRSEGGQFFNGQCNQFVFNGGEFTSASFTFPPFDADGSNCALQFFGEGDDTCATQIGTAFQPSSGQCIGKSDVGVDGVKFMKVECL